MGGCLFVIDCESNAPLSVTIIRLWWIMLFKYFVKTDRFKTQYFLPFLGLLDKKAFNVQDSWVPFILRLKNGELFS